MPEEADAVEAVPLRHVAELGDVRVGPHQLLVLLLHDDEQPAGHVLRPVRRGGAYLPRGVVPPAVALRRRVPVAVKRLEHGFRQRVGSARRKEQPVVEGHVGAVLLRVPAHAHALRTRLGVVRAGVERPPFRGEREPRHRQSHARMEAGVVGVASVLQRVPGRRTPHIGNEVRRRQRLHVLVVCARKGAFAVPEAARHVQRRVLRIHAHAVEVRSLERRHADVLVVVGDPAHVRLAAGRGALLQLHLYVPALGTVDERAVAETAHAGRRFVHVAGHPCPVQAQGMRRPLLLQNDPPLRPRAMRRHVARPRLRGKRQRRPCQCQDPATQQPQSFRLDRHFTFLERPLL